jgi:hypothetical protein
MLVRGSERLKQATTKYKARRTNRRWIGDNK